MTFLSYGMMDDNIYVGMDTLATVAAGEDFHMEKVFYIERPKSIVITKGSMNILAPLVLELIDYNYWFESATTIEEYVKMHINTHLADRIRIRPTVEGKLTTLKIFSWDEGIPTVFEANYHNTKEFVFQKSILQDARQTGIITTNLIDFDSPLFIQNREYIAELYVDSVIKYGANTVEASFIFQSEVAKVNEITGIGGQLLMYSLDAETSAFNRQRLHNLTPEPIRFLSLRKFNMGMNTPFR